MNNIRTFCFANKPNLILSILVDDREDELFVIDGERDWDCAAEAFHSGEELRAAEGGAETVHIFPADKE